MGRVAGVVQYRGADGSLGAAIPGASVLLRPLATGGNRVTATTGNDGRFVASLAAGEYLAAAVHPTLGETPAWTRSIVEADGTQALNLFVPDARARLDALAGSFAGEIGVYAQDLASGDDVAVNADVTMYLASTTKIAIAAACIELMRSAREANQMVTLELRHHREERRERTTPGATLWTDYADIGTQVSVRTLLDRMIQLSDTTATDVLCERYGIDRINQRIEAWGIPGLTTVSSMIELDRRRWWLQDRNAGFLPDYALSLYNRERGVPVLATQWLDQLGLRAPRSGTDVWDDYLAERRDQGTARALGVLLRRIATNTLLPTTWRSSLIRSVLAGAGPGRFRGVTSGSLRIDAKGGAHHEVRAEAGIVKNATGGAPRAVLVALTQRVEHPDTDEASAFVREAGDLALQALGIDPGLRAPTPNSTVGSIVVTSPRPGQCFEPGDRPLIRWATNRVAGPLTLTLERDGALVRTITASAADDGEWHSFQLPDDLPPDSLYRITIAGTDSVTGAPVQAPSARFTVGGALHVTQPTTGEAIAPGSTPQIAWVSCGIEGPLRLDVLRGRRRHATLSTNATDDGEWHSWTVPADTPTGNDYRVRATSVSDPRVVDESGPFRVGGSIEVLSPGLDSALAVGSRPRIRWRSADTVGPLRISLLGNRSRPLEVITSTAADDGEWHSWEVPDVPAGRGYRLSVEDLGAAGVVGLSTFFQIGTLFEWLSPSAEQVNRPWSPAEYARSHYFPFGQPATLRWRRIGPEVGRLRIELRRGTRRLATLTNNAIDDDEWHSWTPKDIRPASDYFLVIRGRDEPAAVGRSVHFSVGGHIDAHINSGVQRDLSAGDSPMIQWVTEGLTGPLTLQLLDGSNTRVSTISTKARDDGVWTSWTVPQNLTGWHRIRIRSNRMRAVQAYTEWFRVS